MGRSDYEEAASVFTRISESYPTNKMAILATGQRANCLLQWAQASGNYSAVTNGFQKVLVSPLADPTARAIARVGLAVVFEKQAESKQPAERLPLLKAALDDRPDCKIDLAYGGAQAVFGMRPDLTTLGKIIGGGLPVGAYGGPSEIMDMIAPVGPVYQAGTLSGNPLAMAAGLATVCHLRDNREIYGRMERMSATLVQMITEPANEAGVQMTANRVGSMFTWFFTPETVTDWLAAATCNTQAFGRFHHGMIEAGVYLPPSQFEAAFLSAAHTDDDISQTVAAAREALTGVHV